MICIRNGTKMVGFMRVCAVFVTSGSYRFLPCY
nr:MAG TPA: hypothetical protein [Caudoviricetes sp.]DAV07701.1 MAG TPA: hypothetical protein [Caudoviricetes sp.]